MGAKREEIGEQLAFDFGPDVDLGTREPVQLELPFNHENIKPKQNHQPKLGDNPTIREQLMKAAQGLKDKK